MEVRECTKCRQIYPLTTEYWKQRANGQFRSPCRACLLEYDRGREQWRQYYADPENKGRMRQYNADPENEGRMRQYNAEPEVNERIREQKRERAREYRRQYNAKPENKERRRQWYARPEVKERRQAYEHKRREYMREYRRQYYANPEKKEQNRERARQYYVDPVVKERVKTQGHIRRAKKRALPVQWNVAIKRAIFSKFGNCCAYCGSQQGLFCEGKMSWDHYIPLKAGAACPGTVPWNMVPACMKCNSSKSASDPRKWLIARFGKRQGGAKAKAIEAHLARMRAEYGAEEPLTPTLPPISGEGGRGEDGRGIVRWS